MSNDKQSSEEQTQWYICPVTKVQCDDECCVSAEDCHIKSWDRIGLRNDKHGSVIDWLENNITSNLDKTGIELTPEIQDKLNIAKEMEEERMINFMQYIIGNEDLANSSSVSKETAKYYLDKFENKERFLKLVSHDSPGTMEKLKWRIANREALREKARKELEELIRKDKENEQ